MMRSQALVTTRRKSISGALASSGRATRMSGLQLLLCATYVCFPMETASGLVQHTAFTTSSRSRWLFVDKGAGRDFHPLFPSSSSSKNSMSQNQQLQWESSHLRNIDPLWGIPKQSRTNSRLYGSLSNNRKNDNDNDDGFLSKAFKKVKKVGSKILPTKWIDPEKAEIERLKQERKDEISGGINKMLKDAPLGVRMIGKLISPLVSGLAESLGEQARQVEELLDDARMFIAADANAREVLGEPISIGAPMSQSSSSVSVNGRQKMSVQVSFNVGGSFQGGVATMTASSGDGGEGNKAVIDSLSLNVAGRYYDIDVSGRATQWGGAPSSSSSSTGKSENLGRNSNIDKNNVIDAEFVEKK